MRFTSSSHLAHVTAQRLTLLVIGRYKTPFNILIKHFLKLFKVVRSTAINRANEL